MSSSHDHGGTNLLESSTTFRLIQVISWFQRCFHFSDWGGSKNPLISRHDRAASILWPQWPALIQILQSCKDNKIVISYPKHNQQGKWKQRSNDIECIFGLHSEQAMWYPLLHPKFHSFTGKITDCKLYRKKKKKSTVKQYLQQIHRCIAH